MTPDNSSRTEAGDRIAGIRLSLVIQPLPRPISDAKVLTGRQRPLTEVALLFCEIETRDGHSGMGFSYSKRAGGHGQYAHAIEIADQIIGDDPSDIQKIWMKLVWAGASVGRSGLSVQAIAAIDVALWDLKAKRAGLPLAKLLGAHRDSVRVYNTSGGFLSSDIGEVMQAMSRSIQSGIGGVKMKVGQPDMRKDLARLEAVREHVGDLPLMVDANQQWTRADALRFGRAVDDLGLVWIEEPVDAYDAVGHAELAQLLTTPIASGEMLTSVAEHYELIRNRSVDILQPDAPRIGGITPFLKLIALADHANLEIAPHYAMEIHLHLSAIYPRETWVEHFEWLETLFNERLAIRSGRMALPTGAGLGFTLSGEMRRLTVASQEFGAIAPRLAA